MPAGLDSGCPSLLLATLPGGITLQVTASEVRCIPPPPPPSTAAAAGGPLPLLQPPPQLWRVPPAVPTGGGHPAHSSSASSLSLAVAKGSWVIVVAGGRRLFVLQVDPASGALAQRYTGEASHSQLSSLALLRIPTPLGQPRPQHREHPVAPYLEPEGEEEEEEEVVREEDLYVAVGEWSESRLLLLSLSELLLLGAGGGSGASGGAGAVAPVMLALELSGETPRSAAMLPAGSDKSDPPLLLVGTNGGVVLVWELQPAEGAGEEGAASTSLSRRWQARSELPSQVRISSVAVELVFHRGGGGGGGDGGDGCIYAHSGSDAIFRRRRRQDPDVPSAGAGRRRRPAGAGPPAGGGEGVEVCRVHGGSGLRAVCPISTATMPRGR